MKSLNSLNATSGNYDLQIMYIKLTQSPCCLKTTGNTLNKTIKCAHRGLDVADAAFVLVVVKIGVDPIWTHEYDSTHQ